MLVCIGLLNIWYYWAVRPRIPFAAAMLEICVVVLQTYPATVLIALASVLVQVCR